jgi:hypothetical protein
MATYNWVISALDTAPQDGQLLDVVKVVHWRYQANEQVEEKSYFAEVYGTMACATPSEIDFTAYPDLTEAQVISWLEAGLDTESLQTNLTSQIENQINPPIINLPLPWTPAPTPTPEPEPTPEPTPEPEA